ncbi:hypothetical protein WICANDRAFT_76047 [Wickerhamomyces anomalus NRRL Y-366-8]|uniref:WW domain-containing protein n=1 Tax=Wickerhamomyces anomalus (strain ATCC 58044 / CBS 1984 / NCYC 433 / NRRL Y-366-8) TaxID=683960 RepID=A0A1E3PAF2_WICAA|nr:uncharacterized protein WICANDRAFT_76047 [Wickerhamomyces anomalus NRRL Y-366-8]ODQ61857.1 hypothetical protein WICANDRAFT_76047 [Wickerhamomyces anomalus NRRL Y-366-8]
MTNIVKDSKEVKPEDKPVEIQDDDGWEHHFDDKTERFFFYNKLTKVKQWLNPRVPKDDECNKDLPKFDPPKLPFEDETLYEQKLRELKEDPDFKELSTFEKYKHVEALKKTLEEQDLSVNPTTLTSSELQENLKDIKPFREDTNFTDYGSKSFYAQELNHSIRSINNDQSKKPTNKVSKKQIKTFNERKKQQRDAKLKKWLTED